MRKNSSDHVAVSDSIRLKAFGKKHLDATRRWVNDPTTAHFIGTVYPIGPSEHANWFEALRRNPNVKFFAVETTEGRHVGNAGVFRYDPETDTARLFVYIGEPDALDRGLGAEITKKVCDYSFRTLGVHRVEATVYAYNRRAAASYRKAGFRQEVRMRDAHFHRGRYHDMLLFGLLKAEWKELKRISK
jgi:RimJ/RimL family protein N-acetyltransferase